MALAATGAYFSIKVKTDLPPKWDLWQQGPTLELNLKQSFKTSQFQKGKQYIPNPKPVV